MRRSWVFSYWNVRFAAHPLSPVCPVQANLVVQENRYVLAMQDLQKAQGELDDKQAELDVVQAEYEQAMAEKQVTAPGLGGTVTLFHGAAIPACLSWMW